MTAPAPDMGADTAEADAPSTAEAPPIRVTGLVSCFGENVIHDGLDLTVNRGEVLAVVGGSGAGKSVLLNTIIGLKVPDGGTVKLFGQDMADASRRRWNVIERRWGVLFQQGALFSNLTVRENVAAPLYEHTRLPRQEIEQLADLKIALVGLPARAGNLKPAELSGGMRKRAGLARALAMDPELLFLDEPTAGLDPISAAAFDELIKDLSDSLDLTVFMITHDLDTLYAITDRIAVIADKKIVAAGSTQELEGSDHPWIKEYFMGPRGRAAAGKSTPQSASQATPRTS
ncbi:ABC-type transport system involved in resistance to organic solvents, ATPase component [Caulobacter sp. AP07]|uniref:ABC transporter ATP-binding protein n=1 Tax=Caulobacter sp. AP07 TaxID=1144304 RepID=UPI0002722577|nr:ABC transporter ATP-binding protein [Caulobacter sp. AP07]EJL26999.1 ABC-type transport system involved in resistance to organic solvents, ATPase component [Caulobacter sp. AP07]